MITIHEATATDCSGLGLGALAPLECEIEEQAGGMYELRMVHPMDDAGKWRRIQVYRIIRSPAPVRETPLVEWADGMDVYEVDVTTSLRLRSAPDTKTGRIIGRYPAGTRVVRISTSGEWFEVIVQQGGATGWMHSDYLRHVETMAGGAQQSVQPRQTREQLFRISDVEVDDERGVISLTALHIFYDLAGNIVRGDFKPEQASAADVCTGLLERALNPHPFRMYCNVSGRVSGDYGRKSIVSALLDEEAGVVPQCRANLVRDNTDIFVLENVRRNRGVEIRHGKNLLGAVLSVDARNVLTRIVPVGQAKNGGALYLDGDGYVESPKSAQIPVMRAGVVEYDVRVVGSSDANADENRFATTAEARERLREMAERDFADDADSPKIGLEVDFIALEQTEEYSRYVGLQQLHLYDEVRVVSPRSGIDATLRMTGYVWDVLANGGRGRYTSVVLGEMRPVGDMLWAAPQSQQELVRRIRMLDIAAKDMHAGGLNAEPVADAGALLSGGAHKGFYTADGTTADTPYAAGLTGFQAALLLSYATSALNGVQMAFCSGTDKVFVRRRAEGVTGTWRELLMAE